MNSFDEVKKIIFDLTNKKNILFMDKCRNAAELLMILAKNNGFKNLILQEEGGWHTYEKSGNKLDLNVLKAPMFQGKLIEERFPEEKALVIVNTNPSYSYVDTLPFYDKMKLNGSLIVNDIVCSIGEAYAKKGDFIIGSFGKDKPLSIASGGAFIAFNDFPELGSLKEEFFKGSGENIDFDDLLIAFHKFRDKKNAWMSYADNLKKELLSKDFNVLNKNSSVNVLVKANAAEMENLIKFCEERNLEYVKCPLYIRCNEEGISIEVKRLNLEVYDYGIKRTG